MESTIDECDLPLCPCRYAGGPRQQGSSCPEQGLIHRQTLLWVIVDARVHRFLAAVLHFSALCTQSRLTHHRKRYNNETVCPGWAFDWCWKSDWNSAHCLLWFVMIRLIFSTLNRSSTKMFDYKNELNISQKNGGSL